MNCQRVDVFTVPVVLFKTHYALFTQRPHCVIMLPFIYGKRISVDCGAALPHNALMKSTYQRGRICP